MFKIWGSSIYRKEKVVNGDVFVGGDYKVER